LHGNLALAGVSVDPLVVVVGSLSQHFLRDGADAQHFAEEIDGILGAGQGGQVAVDDDAIKAVVYEQE
jgi:hypothetical protein